MTTTQLNKHIIHTQNLYADLVYDTYLTKLRIGKLCPEAERVMKVTRKYIDYMYRYQPFEGEVTYAYSFNIAVVQQNENVNVNITILIDPPLALEANITYSGPAVLEDILAYFQTQFEAFASADFEVVIIDGVLWIYSFDTDLDFDDITTVSSSSTSIATITATNQQNGYCEILNEMNCLTFEQLCGIINHGYSLLKECSC